MFRGCEPLFTRSHWIAWWDWLLPSIVQSACIGISLYITPVKLTKGMSVLNQWPQKLQIQLKLILWKTEILFLPALLLLSVSSQIQFLMVCRNAGVDQDCRLSFTDRIILTTESCVLSPLWNQALNSFSPAPCSGYGHLSLVADTRICKESLNVSFSCCLARFSHVD